MCSALPATSFVRVAGSNTSYKTNQRPSLVIESWGKLETDTGRPGFSTSSYEGMKATWEWDGIWRYGMAKGQDWRERNEFLLVPHHPIMAQSFSIAIRLQTQCCCGCSFLSDQRAACILI